MDMRHIMFYFHSTQNIVMSLVTHVGFMPLTSKRFYQRKCHLLDTLVQRFHLHSCICGWLDWYSSQVAGSASTNPIDLSQIITVQLSTSIFTWPNPVFTRPNPVFTRPTTIFNRPSSSIHTAHSYARPTPIFWLSAYNCQAGLIIICCIHLKAAHCWYHNDDDEVCVCVCVLEKIKEIIWFSHNATRQPICSYLYAAIQRCHQKLFFCVKKDMTIMYKCWLNLQL